ncbi:unnamed protein product [Arabis nemorensis]|uniref:GRF-type domain-containing protein n=1 Tax=Arabis nemorensis TaxID=586526 RepID=A0A565BLS8_9BRAS|nr:unnamed protein product [Arabis nemorensis]
MGLHSYSQPTSSPPSSINSEDMASYCNKGIPFGCWCGMDLIMETNEIEPNIGRRYYLCSNAEGGRGHHLFKWMDEAILEELDSIRYKRCQLVDDPTYYEILGEIDDLKEHVKNINETSDSFACKCNHLNLRHALIVGATAISASHFVCLFTIFMYF